MKTKTFCGISLVALFLLTISELPRLVKSSEDEAECPEACSLPSEGGPCLKRKRFRMWYYDTSTQDCRRFSYGGCRGNKNRFWTEEECLHTCGCAKNKQGVDKAAEREKLQAEVCQIYPPDHGQCDTTNIRPSIKWSFNPNTELCEVFAYTGCRGNANRFDNQHQCEEACGDQN